MSEIWCINIFKKTFQILLLCSLKKVVGKHIGLMKGGNTIHILLCNTLTVYYHFAKKAQRTSDFIQLNMVKLQDYFFFCATEIYIICQNHDIPKTEKLWTLYLFRL